MRPLLDHLPAWLLVLFRLTGIFLLAPVLGSPAILRQVKVFLVLGLSLCVYPMLLDPSRPSAALISPLIGTEPALLGLVAAIGLELAIGLAIGYCASLPLIAMQIGGQLIDQQVFPGSAGVFNPDLNEQSTIMGEMLFLTALAVFVILGGIQAMLAALIGSFDHIPPGGFTDFDSLLQLIIGMLASAFEIGLRIAAPLLVLIFLETLAMGFIARTVPGINILSIGFAIRTIAGGTVLVMGVGIMIGIYVDGLQDMMRRLLGVFAW
ncbi:flagellar biosynthetic protein FliR [Phycisphaerales bacterium AB-hyl4]|uniref:Flagellar biosynthetic protein FliR n=1 Tax=Natronomicrosphaera hydrolytica TaxID=3242702 RepID=A0ABV4U4Y9_9BACT